MQFLSIQYRKSFTKPSLTNGQTRIARRQLCWSECKGQTSLHGNIEKSYRDNRKQITKRINQQIERTFVAMTFIIRKNSFTLFHPDICWKQCQYSVSSNKNNKLLINRLVCTLPEDVWSVVLVWTKKPVVVTNGCIDSQSIARLRHDRWDGFWTRNVMKVKSGKAKCEHGNWVKHALNSVERSMQ